MKDNSTGKEQLNTKTFKERCRLSEKCLPVSPYREMLTALHDEMLSSLAAFNRLVKYSEKIIADQDIKLRKNT